MSAGSDPLGPCPPPGVCRHALQRHPGPHGGLGCTVWAQCIEVGFMQKRRQMLSLLLKGQNFFNSLLRWLSCTRTSWRIGCKSACTSTRPGAKYIIVSVAKELKQFCPPRSSDDFRLNSLLHKSFLYGLMEGLFYSSKASLEVPDFATAVVGSSCDSLFP